MSVPALPLRSGTSLSWEEYARLPEDPRVEYVEGRLLVSPSPTRRHQQICHRLISLLEESLPHGWAATGAWSWRTGPDEYIPDVMVHPDTDDDVRFTGTPALVVEVLSSNRADDLVLKANRYAAAGLPLYWIVDPREGTVSVYALDGSLFRPDAHVSVDDGSRRLPAGPVDVDVDLAVLFADPGTHPE